MQAAFVAMVLVVSLNGLSAVFSSGSFIVSQNLSPVIADFDSLFSTNDVKVIYPSDTTPKPLGRIAASVSDWLASMAVSTKLNYFMEGLDTEGDFINQTTGRAIGSPGIGLISFGGPIVNPMVKYAESDSTPTGDRAPIKFHDGGGVYQFRHWDGTDIPGANLPVSVINLGQDMFVIEVFPDDDGRCLMLCYGFGWKGTYAAGKYFDKVVYPNLASYDVNWLIVRWEDTDGNDFVNNPDDGDTYSIVASGTDFPVATTWSQTYGYTNGWATSIISTSDGGYAILGVAYSGLSAADFVLIKTNSTGHMQWSKRYGGPDNDWASSVIQTSDGGYMMVGIEGWIANTPSSDAWLIKVDSAGEVQWDKTYGGSDFDEANFIVQTEDGGYFFVGDTSSQGNGYQDVWFVKIDSSGNFQWEKTYGGKTTDIPESWVRTADGGYAVAVWTMSFGYGGFGDFWLIRTDSSGNMMWNRTYGGLEQEVPYSVIQTDDGGYAMLGWTRSYGIGESDFWLVKVGSAGNVMWNKTYGKTGVDYAEGIVQTDDGGYMISGNVKDDSSDVWLIKTDPIGNVLWIKAYGGEKGDSIQAMIHTGDGGYAMAGASGSWLPTGIWAFKTDSTGNTVESIIR